MTITVTAPRPTEEEILAYRLEQERGDQELGIYKMLLEEANEKGRSFAGHLNKLDAAGILGDRYDLFMKKYDDQMSFQRRFGERLMEERSTGKTKDDEGIDSVVLEELMKQRIILDDLGKKRSKGMPSEEYARLADGGSPEQELVNQRIAELMMEEPVNEMRASSPDVFQKQEQAIESFLGGIGKFADEKNIRFLKQMANPKYARDVAETVSLGADMTPVLGDIQAIREGSRMMGDDQPLMGAALMASGIFTNMPSSQIKKALKELEDKIKYEIPERMYNANNLLRSDSIGDRKQGARWMKRAKKDEKNYLKDIEDAKEALNLNDL